MAINRQGASPATRLYILDGRYPERFPPGCDRLFTTASARSFYHTEAWYRVLIAHALPIDAAPAFALYIEHSEPHVLFPLQMQGHRRVLSSLTNMAPRENQWVLSGTSYRVRCGCERGGVAPS